MVYTPQVCKSVLTSWPPSFYRSSIVPWSCVTCPPVSKATIIPIPKKLSITEINDDRLVALVSDVIKSFKRLLLSHLKAITDHLLAQLQLMMQSVKECIISCLTCFIRDWASHITEDPTHPGCPVYCTDLYLPGLVHIR